MARNREKASSMLHRFRMEQQKEAGLIETTGPRPIDPQSILASQENLRACEKFRAQVVREATSKIGKIMEPNLSEYQIRTLNDEINKLLKEKAKWEWKIKGLGGSDLNRKITNIVLENEGREAPGTKGYRYYGRAKDLPGVKELFDQHDEEETEEKRVNREELLRRIDPDYYGYRDEEDGKLLEYEASLGEDCVQNAAGKLWAENLPSQKDVEEWIVHRKRQDSTTVKNFACPHLAAVKIPLGLDVPETGHLPNAFTLLLEKYMKIINYAQECRLGKDFTDCRVCSDSSSTARLHSCLICEYTCCYKHLSNHLDIHHLAVDFTHFAVYCGKCNDYVYDIDFERVKKLQIYSQRNGNDYPKVWTPSLTEIQIIQKNSSLVKCNGVRGLRNLGSTCFMNAILQAFIHNHVLRDYFLGDHHKLPCKPHCMTCEMVKLFQNFYNGLQTPYGPVSFLVTLWTVSKSLVGYSQQDAHEFFISVLDEIHKNFWNDHKLDPCNCITHKAFQGVLQSNVKCLQCGNINSTRDPFLDISLEIQTRHNLLKDILLDFDCSLMDCLKEFTQPETLGIRQYNCNKCGNTFQEATKQLSFQVLPKILSVQIKRFEHNNQNGSKLNSRIYIPLELDLVDFTTNMMMYGTHDESSTKYSLLSIIEHEGKLDTGHYKCFTKCRDQWFEFDDQLVTLVDSKMINTGNAYMCFYIRDN